MIDPADFLRVVIDPGLRFLTNVMGKDMAGDPARVLLLAIALQESGLEHRRQINDAGQPMDQYARGFWQFELGWRRRGRLLAYLEPGSCAGGMRKTADPV